MTAQNPCLSGGAIEIFLEPVLPAPRVLVVGDTPIARRCVALGAELGLDLVAVDGGGPEPAAGDLALVVAAHGRDELHTLRRGLEAGVPYVGLVASHKRGAGVLAELRRDGVAESSSRRSTCPPASTSARARRRRSRCRSSPGRRRAARQARRRAGPISAPIAGRARPRPTSRSTRSAA